MKSIYWIRWKKVYQNLIIKSLIKFGGYLKFPYNCDAKRLSRNCLSLLVNNSSLMKKSRRWSSNPIVSTYCSRTERTWQFYIIIKLQDAIQWQRRRIKEAEIRYPTWREFSFPSLTKDDNSFPSLYESVEAKQGKRGLDSILRKE